MNILIDFILGSFMLCVMLFLLLFTIAFLFPFLSVAGNKEKNILLQIEKSNIEKFKEKNILYKMNKRLLDLIISILSLLYMSPLMLIVAISYKLVGINNSIITKSIIGYDGVKLNLYYFKTTEEKVSQEEFSAKRGMLHFIEYTGIMYIPLFFSLIKGDITLVGLDFYDWQEFKEKEEVYNLFRYSKPGLINPMGSLKRIVNEEKCFKSLEYDKYYLANRNFKFEITMVLQYFRNSIN